MDSKWDRVCYFCDQTFSHPYLLLQHMSAHTKEAPFFCHICRKGLTTKQSLKNHLRCHMPTSNDREKLKSELKHICNYCGKKFFSKHQLNDHILFHTKEKAFECGICQRGFGRKSNFVQHVKLVHEKFRPFPCKECGKFFRTKNVLKAHLIVHSGARSFKCPKCLKAFASKQGLEYHTKSFHLEGKAKAELKASWKFCCYFCQKKFPKLSILDMHIRIHTKETLITCPLCSKGFSWYASLQTHKKTHFSQEEQKKLKLRFKYPCEICQKRFPNSSELQRHIFSHTKEKSFNCRICKKGFTTKSYLKSHDKAVHKKLRPFKCDECGKCFASKTKLRDHYFIHSEIFDHICPQCPAKFRRKEYLNRHNKLVHLGEREHCPKCTQNFASKQSLRKHINKQH